MNKISAIVVDDELMNRKLISSMILTTNDYFNVVDTVGNIDEAFSSINKHCPNVVFLDIKMPGGSGFDLLRKFKNPKFEVVFVTGFEEYALQAFNFSALDYVLKPIDKDKLKITLSKVYSRIYSKLSTTHNLKEILAMYSIDGRCISKIPIHRNDNVELIDIYDIVSIKADQGYTVFKIFNQKDFISAKQFSSFEFIFEKFQNFIKINKGLYININFIKRYSKGIICTITLKNNEIYEVSRRKKNDVLSFFKAKGLISLVIGYLCNLSFEINPLF